MAELILGVGPGVFAVAFTFVFFLVLTVFTFAVKQSIGRAMSILTIIMPFVVLGLIVAAPKKGTLTSPDVILDTAYPVRVSLIVLLSIAIVAALGFNLSSILNAPPFMAPRVSCRRKQLTLLHPTWMK
jgi:hypothetical protein